MTVSTASTQTNLTKASRLPLSLRAPSADSVTRTARALLLPLLGLLVFLFAWHIAAHNIDTSLGKFPGPAQVYEQTKGLIADHNRERGREAAFMERQEKRNAAALAKDPDAKVRVRDYTGKPTFIDQIGTSLVTVLAGFAFATLIAIPLGILIGLNGALYAALNPLIQLFKPISPLAWLPLVTMVVSALYVSDDPMFAKSFITSLITVSLCSLWPTLINTAVGVSSISQDLKNVSKVLRLPFMTHVIKIAIPASIPAMFTGLRLSLGIAWMVLIAAEMLAQNPGLGKFVWDEFQNGSSNSLGRIMVAVLVIGVIGFMLDRAMLLLQSRMSWDKNALVR
jgi:nitrate/nitrite transport system permease protein